MSAQVKLLTELILSRRLVSFLLVIALMAIAYLAWVNGQLSLRRPGYVKVYQDGKAEYLPFQEYDPGEEQIRRVIDILSNGFLSYSHENWQESFENRKAYLEAKFYESQVLSLKDIARKMREDELYYSFYPKESSLRLIRKKNPYRVYLEGTIVIATKERTKKAPVRYEMVFQNVFPSKENPYGLTLSKMNVVNLSKGAQ